MTDTQNRITPLDADLPPLPAGYVIRHARLEEAEKLIQPFWRNDVLFLGEQDISLQEFVADLQRPDYDPALDARAIFTEEGDCVGYVDVWAEAPYVRNMLFARTDPDHVDKGLGTWLTRWGIRRLRERIVDAAPALRFGVHCFVYAKNKGGIALLENEGFALERIYYDMAIDLVAPPVLSPLPVGITLRTFEPDKDTDRLFTAYDEVFSDHYGYIKRTRDEAFARWRHMVMEHPGYDPAKITLAEENGALVGFCVSWTDDDAPDADGYVHHLGTVRSWRRRGLAQALLTRAFAFYHARGASRVTLGVDASNPTGAVALYERAGMYIKASQIAMQRILREGVVPEA